MPDTGVRNDCGDVQHDPTVGRGGDCGGIKVVFLPVPESLASKCAAAGLPIKPSIPIPVEVSSVAGPEASLPAALENLTVEMIVAGMIRVICSYAAAGKAGDEAAEYYRAFVLAFKPGILSEFRAAAVTHIQNGAYGEAREAIAALLGLFPGSPEVADLKAALDESAGVCGDPDYIEAYRLVSGGDEEAGMGKLRKFLERHPDSWNGWFMLGWALRRLKRWKDAAACFHKCVEAGGLRSDTSNELAICLLESGDYAGARRQLESALSEDAGNTKLISNLAVLELRTGHEAEAAALFRRVIDIDPSDPIAGRFFSRR